MEKQSENAGQHMQGQQMEENKLDAGENNTCQCSAASAASGAGMHGMCIHGMGNIKNMLLMFVGMEAGMLIAGFAWPEFGILPLCGFMGIMGIAMLAIVFVRRMIFSGRGETMKGHGEEKPKS